MTKMSLSMYTLNCEVVHGPQQTAKICHRHLIATCTCGCTLGKRQLSQVKYSSPPYVVHS